MFNEVDLLAWLADERLWARVMPCLRKELATEVVSTMIPP
jgi:hypothetical protein